MKINISEWLDNLSPKDQSSLFEVVNILESERNLLGDSIFSVPHQLKQSTDKVRVLKALHNQDIISVVNKTPNRPIHTHLGRMPEVITIIDDPSIIYLDDTTITLSDKFDQLYLALKSRLEGPVIFLPGQTVSYQNKVLFFKIGDGTPDSIDLSSADDLRGVFEAFWELRKQSNPPKIRFKPEEVLTIYKELFKDIITRQKLASRVSNFRRTKLNSKSHLRERFKIEFDKNSHEWIFEVS